MSDDPYDLDKAYEIDGPDDARRMYGDWAPTYETSFAKSWGYIAPREIAAILRLEIPQGSKSSTSAPAPALSPSTCAP